MNKVEHGSKIRLCVGLQFYSIMIYYNSTDYDWGVEIINLTVIGNLNPAPFTETFGPLQTTEVVVTDERILHIKQRHPEDYLLFEQYGRERMLAQYLL